MPRAATAAVRRWLAVGVGCAVLASLPWAVSRLPAESSDITAVELAARIDASADVAHSGYAEAAGGLVLPITNAFGELADLFGDRTRMRVWYASPTSHRVDAIDYTGETDVYTDEQGTWTWDYEDEEATRTVRTTATVAEISIPAAADLLPPALARRLLSNADEDELSRLPSRRIAGREAVGLRLAPAHPAATVERVDVWADEATGLALRVAVHGRQANAAMDSSFLDVDISAPDPDLLIFSPPPGADIDTDSGDLVGRLEQRGDVDAVALPPVLAGFARSGDGDLLSAGVYGDTVTSFVAINLPERVARSLRRAIIGSPTTVEQTMGPSMTSGPVSALLADTGGKSRWLLAGTVTVDALVLAAQSLLPLEPGA
jgi:hypothetical protein